MKEKASTTTSFPEQLGTQQLVKLCEASSKVCLQIPVLCRSKLLKTDQPQSDGVVSQEGSQPRQFWLSAWSPRLREGNSRAVLSQPSGPPTRYLPLSLSISRDRGAE